MALDRVERILILAKTYPSPSAQYVETSCVAGISQDGVMRRLYPVPFRMIEEGQQFKKWQWIDVRIEKANKDPDGHPKLLHLWPPKLLQAERPNKRLFGRRWHGVLPVGACAVLGLGDFLNASRVGTRAAGRRGYSASDLSTRSVVKSW